MRKYDLVCFDMDGTLTKLRSSWCWVHSCFEVDNEPAYQAFCNGEIDEPEFMRRDIALWTNKNPDVTIRDIAVLFRDMPLIDGIQETIACLKANGIRTVIIPADNERDLEEIDQTVRRQLNFVSASTVDTVLATALNRPSQAAPALLAELPERKPRARKPELRQ